MSADVFHIHRPERQLCPVVFASPHSGRDYPLPLQDRAILPENALRSSEDAYIDQLFAAAPQHGAPLLVARTPRAYIDFNRSPDELDPHLIQGVARSQHNPRISSGLGVIPRVVAGGRAIYSGKITLEEAEGRIARHWHPYHKALRGLIEQTHATFGEALLIDCHSMPHEAIEHHARPGRLPPEIVLGDRFGASAGGDWMEMVEGAFQDAGFRVARNSPFAGAFIAQSYGRPSARRHVIQVEIDRALYLDEARIAPSPRFAAVQALLTGVIARIIAGAAGGQALAAE